MSYDRLKDRKSRSVAVLPLAYDVFVDLSTVALDEMAVAAHLRLLETQCGFGQSAGSLIVALPPGVEPHGVFRRRAVGSASAPASWWRAVTHAASRGRHLVAIFGTSLVGNEAIPQLIDALHLDPMFGIAVPRFSNAETDHVWPLPSASGTEARRGETLRTALPLLPQFLLTAEMLAACIVIRREVVFEMQLADEFISARGAVAHGLCQARRRGFRTVVANRVVVPLAPGMDEAYPAPPTADASRLLKIYSDAALAAAENEQQPQGRLEPLLGAAFPGLGSRRRLLLDCRGLNPIHNGTSKCVLGFLDGFAALNTSWQFDVVSGAAGAKFHDLAERFPTLNLLRDQMSGYYTATLKLDQPWDISTIAESHRHGFLIGFNILDTISYDVLYPAPERLERVWRFAARHSDLLTYISAFTRDRFRSRFPVAKGVAEKVVHLSLVANEHTHNQFGNPPIGEDILLFGNDYDHKGIGPMIRLLVDAFPFQNFVVLGGKDPGRRGVRTLPSGQLSQEEVKRLVVAARAIVFPSFYEGFGLPVVEALAHGRPVLVRRSPLWTEIAAYSRLPGRLIEFEDPVSLVEMLGRVLSGTVLSALTAGTALDEAQQPAGWRDAAQSLVMALEDRLWDKSLTHWQHRDEALRMAGL
jgi:glycosyltransferase involved in cell wall biosynthesis